MRKFQGLHLLITLFILGSLNTYAQTKDISVLLKKLGPENTDSIRIKALADIGLRYLQLDLDSAYYYQQELSKFATEIKSQKGIALSLNLKVGYLAHKRKLSEALEINREAWSIAEPLDDNDLKSLIYNSEGMVYHSMNDSPRCIAAMIKALEYAKKGKDKHRVPIIIGNLGFTHLQNNNLELASHYLEEAKSYADTMQNIRVKSFLIRNLGLLNSQKGLHDEAEKYLLEAKELSHKSNDRFNEAYSFLCLGQLYVDQKKYTTANKNFEKALNLFQKLGNVEHQTETYISIIKTHNATGNYDETIKQALEVSSLISSNKSTDIKAQYYEELAHAYSKKGEYKKAYSFHKKYKNWADSVYTIQKANKTLELESKHQLEKKELIIKQLNIEKESIEKERKLILLISILSLAFIIISGLYLWTNFRANKNRSAELEKEVNKRTTELKNSNKKLLASNNELERFAYITSHDLKEPLRNIHGFSDLAQRAANTNDKNQLNNSLQFIKSNAAQMNSLIEDVLNYSKIKMHQEYEINDLNSVIQKVNESLRYLYQEKKPIINISKLPKLKGSQFQFFQLFKNLIENGIKYNKSEQIIIHINAEEKDDKHLIRVKDNGIGIAAKYHEQVFTMFKRLHSKSEYRGTGLGLATVKKIAENLNGDILIKSDIGQGSEFIISIPK